MLRPIIEKGVIDFGVAHIYPNKIDEINILNASILAMHHAIDELEKVEFISVDADRFRAYKTIPHETIIKGDVEVPQHCGRICSCQNLPRRLYGKNP